MIKLRNIVILSTLMASPLAFGHFDVYWKSYRYEHDNGIRYGVYNEPREQCMRSRYGNPYGPWPCETVIRSMPGDSYYYRRHYPGLLDYPDEEGVYRGLNRLRDKK